MTMDQFDRTVVTEDPPVVAQQPAVVAQQPAVVAQQPAVVAQQAPAPVIRETVRTDSRHTTLPGPSGAELARRVVVLVFGLIQILIAARIVLLLLNAREANGLVSGILDLSQIFVAPFNGMLNTNALTAGHSLLDLAAVLAFIGWTILELIVIWVIGIFRREPA